MADTQKQQRVHVLLRKLQGLDVLKQLFWSELNYESVNEPLSRRGWSDTAANALAENPLLFGAAGGEQGFHILYARLSSERMPLGLERPVVSTLLREHPYALIVFSNSSGGLWHFVNVKYDTDVQRRKIFRRIVVGPTERLRTAAERLAMLDIAAVQQTLFGIDALTIQKAHDDAFDVEAVTEQFFGYYQVIFAGLQKDLRKQTRDAQWAHDFAQQFLNRLMFLYFIQRKRWLGDDPDFICNYWTAYKNSHAAKDTFYSDWLSVLFFEAFNNQFQAGRSDRKHLPKEFRDALAMAPYLNGGLFAKSALDTEHAVTLRDDCFVTLFDRFEDQNPGFFERYNFTIREDSPFDQEVAVDPEMIGKVYESLVNVTSEGLEEEDQRGKAGIFYTQRIEIDLMCRLALVDYLTNHLGEQFKPLIYQAVFAYDDADKQAADLAVGEAKLSGSIDALLRKLTVCDPACGSGSFIVGMLMVVDDLQARANKQLGITETTYQRRKRIIGQSLYGVDVMDWAVRTAELRLWLQLIVETDLDAADRKTQPLLPNLSFKLRVGDSLVQQVGGIIFNVDREHLTIPAPLKRKLTELKEEKLKFYNDVRTSKFKSAEAVKKEELNIFREILETRASELDQRIRDLKREIANPPEQMSLLGMEKPKAEQLELFLREKQEALEAAQNDLKEVESARTALRTAQNVPFVWDIAFVEVFETDEEGFGIIVGNPPYVRQEMIAPPLLREEDYEPDVWREKKRDYKAQLQLAVAEAFPQIFKFKHGSVKFRRLDGKCDLYVYFYLLGLKRLNRLGSFCFITSNSWLDVGYGKDLQEFLLTQSHVKMILDNEKKRSFKQADVNTIIALLSPPCLTRSQSAEKTARFVMFRMPFENVLSPVVFQEIDQAFTRKSTPEYRVTPVCQSELLAEGMAKSEDGEPTQARSLPTEGYVGSKWGGKYLRAPDIFFTILGKAGRRFQKLGESRWFRLGRGRRTGADDFFYLDKATVDTFGIEKKYLRLLVKSPTQFSAFGPATSNLPRERWVFLCEASKSSLRDTGALRYIKAGEAQRVDKGNLACVDGKWWNLGTQPIPQLILPIAFNDRFFAIHNDANFEVHQRFATIVLDDPYQDYALSLAAYLNSTLVALMAEVYGRRGLGQGALDFPPDDWRLVLIPKPETFDARTRRELESRWQAIKSLTPTGIEEEIKATCRRELDATIFDVLKLTSGERNAVYEAVVGLVKKRLEKAGSV